MCCIFRNVLHPSRLIIKAQPFMFLLLSSCPIVFPHRKGVALRQQQRVCVCVCVCMCVCVCVLGQVVMTQ